MGVFPCTFVHSSSLLVRHALVGMRNALSRIDLKWRRVRRRDITWRARGCACWASMEDAWISGKRAYKDIAAAAYRTKADAAKRWRTSVVASCLLLFA